MFKRTRNKLKALRIAYHTWRIYNNGERNQDMQRSSWKTTTAGILAIVAAVAGAGVTYLNGGDVDYAQLATVITGALAGLGLLAARDNRVTSEDVGATRPLPPRPLPPRPETPEEVRAAWRRVFKQDPPK